MNFTQRNPAAALCARTFAALAALAALTAFTASGSALAQAAAPKAPEPDYTLAYNLGAYSDYRYRGISQTRFKPAVQGGVDFAHKSGAYASLWASNIQWIKDVGVKGAVEVDVSAGYKGQLAKDVAFDVGVLRYQFQGNALAAVPGLVNAHTNELYAAVSLAGVTAKYSHAVSNLFGNANSKGSGYADLSYAHDFGSGLTVTPHVGYQKVKNVVGASYTDYSVTVAKDFDGWVLSAAFIGTNADRNFYVPGSAANSNAYLGKKTMVVGLKKNF